MTTTLSETNIAWLAGLLEGEGAFCLDAASPPRKQRPSLVLAVQMCDEDIIERVAEMVGGNATTTKRRQFRPNESPSWRVKVTGQKAEDAMLAVLPYMGQRRSAKIKECLAADNLSHRKVDAP